ncbi:hypothetical protein CPB86DRAFT_876622 [Serendipita vermifera]|nr:hypothetical protein CPB86DRAFT_876622 [Serendipita vermifera]
MNEKVAEGRDTGSNLPRNTAVDVKEFVREINGRIFSNLRGGYLLPSDEMEWVRLEKQSVALLIAMGGLYLCPEVVESILSSSDGQEKHVLDIGCGTGSWAMEMARRFPHASVLGVDIFPPPVYPATHNLHFDICDVNLGMTRFHEQFDVVHARGVGGGIKDIDLSIVEFQKCLKPGGILFIMDGDMIFYENRDKPVRMKKLPGDPDVDGVSEDGSWLQRIIAEAREGAVINGADKDRYSESVDLGLWNYPFIDPETARAGGIYLPLGPWAKGATDIGTQSLQYAGELMQKNYLNIHRAYHSRLLQCGLSQNDLNEWSSNIDDELDMLKKKLWVRFRFCWGRRSATGGSSAPSLPLQSRESLSTVTSPQEEAASTIPSDVKDFRRPPGYQYPAIEIFTSREEASAERTRRESGVGQLPELMVRKAWRMGQKRSERP